MLKAVNDNMLNTTVFVALELSVIEDVDSTCTQKLNFQNTCTLGKKAGSETYRVFFSFGITVIDANELKKGITAWVSM